MKRLVYVVGALVAVVAVSAMTSRLEAQEPTEIKDIMKALAKSPTALMPTAKKALRGSSPDFAAIHKSAEALAKLTGGMAKLDPPQGEKASFSRLAEALDSNVKAVVAAAKKDDLDATKAAVGKIGMSCMGCHKSHRPQ